MKKEMNEEQILRFWKKRKIYEKSKKKNSNGKKFYLMDGPPYATGSIHMGTALNKILKDIAMRSQRLQGKNVFDRAGYDTHGLPIEFQIEKKIKSKSKQDIEKFGVKRFVNECKKFATKYISVMNRDFENLGVWMDFENPYLTLSNEYIETIWDCFKVADKKGLLYLGKYPVHVCPRCETAVAYNEIEYEKKEDTAIYVKFGLKNKKNTFLIIWTTTAWTLPGNTAIIVNPNFDYQEIELSSGERWIIAKELVAKIMKVLRRGFTPKKTYKGKEMEGWNYENPLSKYMRLNLKNSYRVILSSRYVNLEEGTGLVHCAPGHGKEDYEVGTKAGVDVISPVDISGKLSEETGRYSGGKAKIIDKKLIEDLKNDRALIYEHKYTHDYPLCWRCKSALLMISQPQWFLKISEIHEKILKENEQTNWVPSWMKLRMKAWLEGISDWPVSRERYWGTPLPIWTCECGERKVIGSSDELKRLSRVKNFGLHRPEIDKIEILCKCGNKMKRISGVLDVWFDSGVSSWAALKFKGADEFRKFWAADLNIEGKDQFRGWWNSQIILSEIKFDKKPFENIVVHGMILDLGKRKMSKSLGNITSPQNIIKKYSRDYLRYYFAKVSKGEDFAFEEREFKEIQKVFRILTNISSFIFQLEDKRAELKIEDKWILSKYNALLKNMTDKYNEFKFPEAVQLIEEFLGDLSRTYIQIIRDRADETKKILNEIYRGLLKLLTPIIPFTTEKIWQDLRKREIVKEESIHLTLFPKSDSKKINNNIEQDFATALDIVEAGLAERNKKRIGLKWPLAKAEIVIGRKINSELKEIIARQLNVKEVWIREGKKKSVKLDTKLTTELEQEGYAREIARKIQALRKMAGLVKNDKIDLLIVSDLKLDEQEEFIKGRTNSRKIVVGNAFDKNRFKHCSEGKIKDSVVKIYFNKV